MKHVYAIMYGPPGVGKSTIAKLLSGRVTIVESDQFRGEAPGFVIDKVALEEAVDAETIVVQSCPRSKHLRGKYEFMLEATDDVLIQRLMARTNNEFGKTEAEQKLALGCADSMRGWEIADRLDTSKLTEQEVADRVWNYFIQGAF